MIVLRNGFFFLILACSCFAQQLVTNEDDLGGEGLSLRQAIEASNSGETITFAPSVASKTIKITQGEILIEKDLVIEGSGPETLVSILGNQNARLIRVAEEATLTLRYLQFSNGTPDSGDGGAILNEGNLVLENCRVTQCRARSGGAIFSNGNLTLSNCELIENISSSGIYGGGALHCHRSPASISGCIFRNNRSEYYGGAIFNSGVLGIIDSTFEGNTSTDDGAGIFNDAQLQDHSISVNVSGSTFFNNKSGSDSGALHISRHSAGILENCTFTENFANDGGGAIENSQGNLTVTSCTIANNQALQRGGGIFTLGQTNLKNCLLSGNRNASGSNDLQRFDLPEAFFVIQGANLVEEPGNSNLSDEESSSVLSDAALLFPLGFYGGKTRTMPPRLDSPALNAAIDSTLNRDQRGFPRFADSMPDLGAIEFIGVANEILIDSDSDGVPNGVETVTGTNPLVADPEHPGHLRISVIAGEPVLSFGYLSSTSSRFALLLHRSTDLQNEEVVLSSVSFSIPNSIDSPFQFVDPSPAEGRVFYRLEVVRR